MKNPPPASLTIQNWSPNGSLLPTNLFPQNTEVNIASSNGKKHYDLTWNNGASQSCSMTLKWHGGKQELKGNHVTITGPTPSLPTPLLVTIVWDAANNDWSGNVANPQADYDGTSNTGTFVADTGTGPIPPPTLEE